MAKRSDLENLPAVTGNNGGPSVRYPWDDWLDGSVWELTSADFGCSIGGFRSQGSKAASERGLIFASRHIRDITGQILYIQARSRKKR